MLIRFALPAALGFGLMTGLARTEEPLFPFVISYDAPQNVTNVSAWLDRPAGKHGFVRVQDGRLATDAGPIRFWATNFCFEACFPSHEQAQRVAARLARLGINCVRLHHMDSRSIWGDSPNKLTIDPQKLERLDYLIDQLKRHGIYVDVNLHVSRWFGPAEGFVAREQRPKYDKGLDNFEPRMIELQKKYARDLLTHVNPYTKTSYAAEPAVAFVEISNEDSLFVIWNKGDIDSLPEPYAAAFRKLWNAWLRNKHGSTERLRKAWQAGQRPLGSEMLTGSDFSQPLGKIWRLQSDDRTAVDWSVQPGGPEAKPYLRVVVKHRASVPWQPQLMQGGFQLTKGTPYTLTCYLRADKDRRIGLNCMMNHEPWKRLGLSADASVGVDWKRHQFTFTAQSDEPNARITFTGLEPGTLELAGVSLRPGGVVGLEPGQRLEDDTVPALRRKGPTLTKPAQDDFVDFLWDTERDYWWGMYRFLKDELGVRPLVSGTQLGYSPVHIQAGLDYLDAHSYWHHPVFPGRPWDLQNWYVHNAALVNSPDGTLAGLAVRRVAGMPYTVSEYNHPAPNVYAAEGFPMIAAFGAFQAWDAIFSFAYCHSEKFEPRYVESYFETKCHTAKIAHMPACAALFLRGDAAPARKTLLAPLSPEAEHAKLHETPSPRNLTADKLGLDPRLSLLHAMALDLGKGKAAAGAESEPALPEKSAVFVSDTGQIRWDVSGEGAGCFTVDTPRTKLFTGFVAGRTFKLGQVTLSIGRTRLDWATISMACIDGEGFDRPGCILLAATGWVQNKDAELEHLKGDEVTLRNKWGTEPVLCEGIPAVIVLPVAAPRVSFYPLDESGNRRAAAAVAQDNGKAKLILDSKHKTVWYEAEIK